MTRRGQTLDPELTRTLDAAIARMVHILETDRWPSGLELAPDERRLVQWNLGLAREERTDRRTRDARD